VNPVTRDPDFEVKVGKLGHALAQLPDPRQLTFLDIIEVEAKKEQDKCQQSDRQATPSTPSK
jgi:hypothetical protein